jgi:ferritin-like protein
MTDNRVHDLLGVPELHRDPDWLLDSLQVAVELELSTLPPYLCGLWSIKDQNTVVEHPTPNALALIRSVVFEEMVHMGLACNMLSTIGGTPRMVVPRYPGPLPGGVRPDLTVYLSGLTHDLVRDVFLQIEMPEHPVPIEMSITVPAKRPEPTGPNAETTYHTIGEFYDAISKAFEQADESIIKCERQLTTSFSDQEDERVYPIDSRRKALQAITEIKEQGEGTSRDPEAVGFHELAHFYRFGELYEGKALKKVAPDLWAFDGDPIAFPDCWPMAEVPDGGYSHHVTGIFDGLFTSVLANLEAAWMEGGHAGQAFLQNGVNVMFSLAGEATRLMQIPAPGGGNYGPDFRLASRKD